MYQSNLNDNVFFFLCQKPKRDWNQSCPCSYYVLSSPRLSLIPALNCLTLILAAKMIVKQHLQYHIKYSETHQSHSFQFLFEIHTVPQFCDFSIPSFSAVGYSQTWFRQTHSGNALLQARNCDSLVTNATKT